MAIFDEKSRNLLERYDLSDAEEIRLRSHRGIEIMYADRFEYIKTDISPQEIFSVIRRAMRFSLFANEDAMKKGQIVIDGGHRVSFAGKMIMVNEKISSMDSFNCVCVRLSREIIGSAKYIIPHILTPDGQLRSTLIISPPGMGKTTVLRDAVRIIASGKNAKKTVIIDERGEICPGTGGKIFTDAGERSDVLSNIDKKTGINIAVRSLSPQLIATDEIGSEEDSISLGDAVRCGVKIIATAHSDSMADLKRRRWMERIISERVFERYIFIRRIGGKITAESVYDASLREVMI